MLSVGNKDDDPSRKVVNPQDARAFASQMGIELFETSAKENKNVEEVNVLILFKATLENLNKFHVPNACRFILK